MTAEITRVLIMLAVFAAVFLIAQAVATSYAANRSYRGAVNKRLRMISSGENREVVVGKLIKNRPRDRAELPEGIEALLAKRYPEARRAFEAAARLQPANPSVQANLERLAALGYGDEA